MGAYGYKGYAGAAYIFKRTDQGWTEIKKLVAPKQDNFDEFAYSIALSHGHAIIGVYGANDQGNNSGAAYIFEK